MSTRTRIARRLLTALTLGTLAGGAPAQSGSGAFTSYQLINTDLGVNEPVLLKVSIENRTPYPLTVNLGSNGHGCCGFRAHLVRPDGQAESGPRIRPSELSVGDKVIEPLSTFSIIILVNKWFSFDIPGRYLLDVDNASPFGTDRVISPYPTDGHLIVDIGPRNPARLRQICEDLESRSSGHSRDATEAVEILAHVDDPIAVPFIAALLQSKERIAVPMLTETLARIADSAAVDALLSRLNGPWLDEDMPAFVRRALESIGAKTHDALIKARIEGALR